MKREIIKTADGSSTIFLPEWNEHYHSKHGAVQEAYHVFIRTGFHFYLGRKQVPETISILEIGFGTGLNALITLLEARAVPIEVSYTGIEAYPVSNEEIKHLNYASLFPQPGAEALFNELHRAAWEQPVTLDGKFKLVKKQMFFNEIKDMECHDLIYFDAFGPRVQPELWTEEIFKRMHAALTNEGVLVTYSAKGSVRRAMQAVGFKVERLPGPPGKREMLRASKSDF